MCQALYEALVNKKIKDSALTIFHRVLPGVCILKAMIFCAIVRVPICNFVVLDTGQIKPLLVFRDSEGVISCMW